MLLFSLSVVVSVELSVACNIHIRESEMGQERFRCLQSTCYSFFFNFPANGWSNPEVYLA